MYVHIIYTYMYIHVCIVKQKNKGDYSYSFIHSFFLSLIYTYMYFWYTTATFSRSQNSWMSIDQNVLSIAYQAGTNWQLTYIYFIYLHRKNPKLLIFFRIKVVHVCDVHACDVQSQDDDASDDAGTGQSEQHNSMQVVQDFIRNAVYNFQNERTEESPLSLQANASG